MTIVEKHGYVSRQTEASEIPAEGIAGSIIASASERAALAAHLDLAGLDTLMLSYRLVPCGRGRFRLSGNWQATARLTCGVTLEPIEQVFDEYVTVEFWSPEVWERHLKQHGELVIDPEEETPELIEQGLIDIGRLLQELLGVSLPPFPRRDDAELEWRETVEQNESPFAVLKTLSGKKQQSE